MAQAPPGPRHRQVSGRKVSDPSQNRPAAMSAISDNPGQPSVAPPALSAGQRLAMLLLNYIPFALSLAVLAVAIVPWSTPGWRLLTAVLALYALPPVIARTLIVCRPIRQGVIPAGSPGFLSWWALLNLQVIFSRLPALEELLRLVPGLYSAWLRLWGSRVGRLTYWAAGTTILDRSFLEIGDDVVFGAGVRLNPHVMTRDESGRMVLLLATVKIGDRCVVGGYGLLTAGTELPPDECSRACLLSAPFTRWRKGQRVRE